MSFLLLVLYQLAATCVVVLASPYLAWRTLRHPREMAERFGLGADGGAERGEGPLWLHAASLGELEAVRTLWETAPSAPRLPLLLTVLSVSARTRAEAIAPAGCTVRFAPLDAWFALLPFLRRTRPRALVLVETELWPLLLAAAHARGIPVVLVSGRLSPRKWSRTRLLAPLLRPLVRRLAACLVQSGGDAARFRRLGVREVEVAGNLKYRLPWDPAPVAAEDGRFVFVAGSVRSGEEAVLEVASRPGMLCVIAPRHLREREHWLAAARARGIEARARRDLELTVPAAERLRDPAARASLRTALDGVIGTPTGHGDAAPRLLLVDRHGELASWYAVADAAFVGGTLVPIGGHNLFEAARCGVPVIFGPFTAGVEDAAEPLLRLGGGWRASDAAGVAVHVTSLRDDPRAARRAGEGAAEAARTLAGAPTRTFERLAAFPWFPAVSVGAGTGRRGER